MNSAGWILVALVGMLQVDQTPVSPDIEVLVRVASNMAKQSTRSGIWCSRQAYGPKSDGYQKTRKVRLNRLP